MLLCHMHKVSFYEFYAVVSFAIFDLVSGHTQSKQIVQMREFLTYYIVFVCTNVHLIVVGCCLYICFPFIIYYIFVYFIFFLQFAAIMRMFFLNNSLPAFCAMGNLQTCVYALNGIVFVAVFVSVSVCAELSGRKKKKVSSTCAWNRYVPCSHVLNLNTVVIVIVFNNLFCKFASPWIWCVYWFVVLYPKAETIASII